MLELTLMEHAAVLCKKQKHLAYSNILDSPELAFEYYTLDNLIRVMVEAELELLTSDK